MSEHNPDQPDDQQRQERQRRQEERRRRAQSTSDKEADDKAKAEQKEAMAAASIGAQVILDYNGDGSKGARGGAGGTIEENSMARDAYLVGLGLDPAAPSGPPPEGGAEALRKQQEAAAPKYVPSVSGKATRVSSLAAGIEASDIPPPEPETPPPA